MDYKLSIIVSCYNDNSNINKLLDSIINNDLEKNEYELIICSDNLTDNFTDTIKTYEDKINISYYKVDTDIHCLSNLRQLGLNKAKGEWITFIDYDSYFEPGIFKNVFKTIENEKIDTVLCTSFYIIDKNNEKKNFIVDNNLPWVHGKFYNHQMLINQKIGFKENIKSHEDVYFNIMIEIYLQTNNKQFYFAPDLFTCNWFLKQNPALTEQEENLSYIDFYFKDFVCANTEPYFIVTNETNKNYCVQNLMLNYLLIYFFYQQGIYKLGENYPKYNQFIISELKQKIIKTYGINNEDIINFLYSDPNYYNSLRTQVLNNGTNFIEAQSLRDFILNH